MINFFKNLETENIIAIIGIAVPIFSASVAFIIKAISDSKKRNEELRPNVFISYEQFWKNGMLYQIMTLKNYGMTTAQIQSIEITPPITNKGPDLKLNTFTAPKNYPLAPQQEITIGRASEKIIPELRHFKITYTNIFFNKKPYISEYDIDEKSFPTLRFSGNDIKKTEVKLDSSQFRTLSNMLKKEKK